jgi:DNA repair exonuclease SbcCD ATPase subunit
LQSAARKVKDEREAKIREVKNEIEKEKMIQKRLEESHERLRRLEIKLSEQESKKLEASKATQMREKVHESQILKIKEEKQYFLQNSENLKSRIRQLEGEIRDKKLEMNTLDSKLKDLVHTRSLSTQLRV